jgi:FAD/FMN-containing dehydrogenase
VEIIYFKSISELRKHLHSKRPTLYVGSRTSTVLPYEQFIESPKKFGFAENLVIADLSSLPKSINLNSDGQLIIKGPVNWQEAKAYCLSQGREILTSPTEELALCLSGVATSATGERCFGHGTLRDQIVGVTFIDSSGVENTVKNKDSLKDLDVFKKPANKKLLEAYSKDYEHYRKFKNAPFPRLEKQTDLMIGTEGQLGIITSATYKTTKKKNEIYLFFKLPKWEINFDAHLEIFNKIQSFRDEIVSCELVDENSIRYLPIEERPAEGVDLLFLEIEEDKLDYIYENLLSELTLVSDDDVFQMNSSKCRDFRMNIPRFIFEENQKMGVTKVGTDVQVRPEGFKKLIDRYKMWKDDGIPYNLFGHFGDAHLHFNFMPKPEELDLCKEKLEAFYHDVKSMDGSPFAEHGIGTLKRKYIEPFYNENQKEMFKVLKKYYDPDNILFPNGYMSSHG